LITGAKQAFSLQTSLLTCVTMGLQFSGVLNMRTRTIALIVAIFLMTGFALLNMDEFSRPTLLSLGFTTVQAPLGFLLLGLLLAVLLVFLATTLYMQGNHLLETRQYARELSTQRELADKAEASRFTELRQYLDAQAANALHREAAQATVLAERLAQSQEALMTKIDQSANATAACIGELEDRLERRDEAHRPPQEPEVYKPFAQTATV
jgi:predicted membrane chloride channel (bestrophin family)